MQNRQEAYDRGYNRGRAFSTAAEACCEACCFECEANDRQSADFAYGDCYDLNALPEDGRDEETGLLTLDRESAWEAYEEAVGDGICALRLPESCKENTDE